MVTAKLTSLTIGEMKEPTNDKLEACKPYPTDALFLY